MQHRLTTLFTFLFQFTGHGNVRHKKIKMDKQGWGRRQPSTPNRRHSWDSRHANHAILRVISAPNLFSLSTRKSHPSYLDRLTILKTTEDNQPYLSRHRYLPTWSIFWFGWPRRVYLHQRKNLLLRSTVGMTTTLDHVFGYV